MKFYFYLSVTLLALPLLSFSQLTYLGQDKPDKTAGYPYNAEAGNLVNRNGKFYFSSPNGAIYETDGSAQNTRIIFYQPGNQVPVLAATEKYLYFNLLSKTTSELKRIQPEAKKIEVENLYSETPAESLQFNASQIPGSRNRVDQLFVTPDKKNLFIRRFRRNHYLITHIADAAPNKLPDVMAGPIATKDKPDMPIAISAQLAFNRNSLFFNGYERNMTDRNTPAAFTTVIFENSATTNLGYEFKKYHYLHNQGLVISPGFLSSGSEIYSLIKKATPPNEGDYMLMRYDGDKTTIPVTLPSNGLLVSAEEHDDQIYLIRRGEIKRFNKANNSLASVFYEANLPWLTINNESYLVKVGDYLMTRNFKGLLLINEKTGNYTPLDKIVEYKSSHIYRGSEIYVYGGNSCFYMMTEKDWGKLTRYDPVTKTSTVINFPELKNLVLIEISSIVHLKDRFVILTRYSNKRGDSSWHIYMYKE